MSYLPTGAFVCPRSHNLGIAFWGFIVPLHPSNHARDHVLRFYSSTPVTQPISEPGQTKEPDRIFIYIYHKNHTKCGYHIPIPWILWEWTRERRPSRPPSPPRIVPLPVGRSCGMRNGKRCWCGLPLQDGPLPVTFPAAMKGTSKLAIPKGNYSLPTSSNHFLSNDVGDLQLYRG